MIITGEQVKTAMIAANIRRVDHHTCGACGVMVAYIREGENLFFDGSCDCTSFSDWRTAEWTDAASWINMQNNPKIKQRIMEGFGLTQSKEQ